jgi:hypothetical protein
LSQPVVSVRDLLRSDHTIHILQLVFRVSNTSDFVKFVSVSISTGVAHDNVHPLAVRYSHAAHVGISLVVNFESKAVFKSQASNTCPFVKLEAA